MATIGSPFDDEKFNKIYRFVVLTSVIIFVYIFAISFIPIDKENKDNIKTVLIFLLGYLSSNGAYLTSGNPGAKKPDNQITGDNNTVTPPINVAPVEDKAN